MRSFVKSPIFLASLIAILLWIPMLTSIVGTVYWNVRYKISREAPAEYVIISLDRDAGETIAANNPARTEAKLISALNTSAAKQIYVDLPESYKADDVADSALNNAIEQSPKNIAFVARANYDIGYINGNLPEIKWPIEQGKIVYSNWALNSLGAAVFARSVDRINGNEYRNIAAIAAGKNTFNGTIYGDFSVNPSSIRTLSANDVLTGKFTPHTFDNATVFITYTGSSRASSIIYFGAGRQPSVKHDIAGIVALKRGNPIHIPDFAWLVLFAVFARFGIKIRNKYAKWGVYSALLGLLIFAPATLTAYSVFSSSELGIIAAFAYAPLRFWQKRRAQDRLTNSISGLPTIEALALEGFRSGCDVVAVVISQYEHMLSSLPRELHGECAQQISRRLAIASELSAIHATENGYFVWLEAPCTLNAQVAQLEGLRALFASPLVIGGKLFDTNVHFGLDRNGGDDPMSRIQAALAAAGEAQIKGKLYEEFELKRRQESPWELSLHARIDEGLRNGDIWLAFQPQLNLRTGEVSGAEALIRWNDPERGAIPPDAFILQAERAGRIEAITYWVIERAMEASETLAKIGNPIDISVNLSARLVDHPDLVTRISQLASRHAFDTRRMTFEVTETFSMVNRDQAVRNLEGLRHIGFRLSIDDFGTGHASLAYLAEIPSDEIKLDKQFVQRITSDRRERIIVRSVINLAHALGHVVCAEGIEDEATLKLLRHLNCDLAQGYHIGRPQRLEALLSFLVEMRTARENAVNAC